MGYKQITSRSISITVCLLLSNLAFGQNAVSAADAEKRAREIVGQMTLDEKITELHGIRDTSHYRYVPGIERLHIPGFQITNGPAGAGPGGTNPQAKATALPAPIALAATWDRDLARLNGVVIAVESKGIGNGLVETPTINIARVPQNGRSFEGYGEDPYLIGQIAVHNIQGIQSQGVIANVKHYAGNNQETDRKTIDDDIDERTLREIYLPAFELSIKEGHSASLMCAYPKVNGAFSCENKPLLIDILKNEWGFDGFVTSDFGAVHSTVPSALNGLDLEMPTGIYFGDALKAAVESGQVPISVIDDKLIRRFKTMIRFGIFDNPPTPKPLPEKEDGATARKLAEESMVLLKNAGGILPLNAAHLKSIAVIGPYAAKAMTGGGGSSHVVPLYTVDPVDGIKTRVGSKAKVDFADGTDINQAAALAKAADVAIVMVGDNEREGRDHSITLEGNQDQLVQAIVAANQHTVVVLKTGSAVLMPWTDQAPAILEAWYPGEEDGNAVAAVLFGDVNPSGKLPVTFPKSLDDVPASKPEQYPGVNGVAHYSEGVFVGYRYYDAKDIQPLFPFGHGLSYTSFEYHNLRVSPASLPANGNPKVSVDLDVSNSGKVAGSEVVQLYLGMPSSKEVPQPPRQLKGFQKVHLEPGKKTHIHFELDTRAVSYWDVGSHKWAVAAGDYIIMIGSSSRDIRQRGHFQLKNSI